MRHENQVVDAIFSPDGARIGTASKDRTARLWDATTLKPVGQPMQHEHAVDHVAFNSTGTRIVTDCYEAGLLWVWDAATAAPVGEAMPHKPDYPGELVPFSADGNLLTTIPSGTRRRAKGSENPCAFHRGSRTSPSVRIASASSQSAAARRRCGA
jgi:WD40 repeat protein